MATRLDIAKSDISKVLAEGPKILRPKDLSNIFTENRSNWRLAQYTTLNKFSEFLTKKSNLREIKICLPRRIIHGYTWGDVPLLETLIGLVNNSHYSHYTAMKIHGLTEQSPKTIFLSQEKRRGEAYREKELIPCYQEKIDDAFLATPRMSRNQTEIEDVRLVLLDASFYDGLGIIKEAVNFGGERPLQLRYTSLERTMIDITVRPFYAGGIFEVAKAFENAKDHLSVNTMRATLKKMRLTYPYHQAIGYYLERAGYRDSQVNLFRLDPIDMDFYLTHGMTKKTYVKHWRLFIPEGF